MPNRKIKIGGKTPKYTLTVDINGQTFSVPLAKSLTYKELKSLKDEESIHDFFARYIDSDVLDNLMMDEYNQLMNAWAEANDGESLGE